MKYIFLCVIASNILAFSDCPPESKLINISFDDKTKLSDWFDYAFLEVPGSDIDCLDTTWKVNALYAPLKKESDLKIIEKINKAKYSVIQKNSLPITFKDDVKNCFYQSVKYKNVIFVLSGNQL